MAEPRRFYVRSPDGSVIAGYDNRGVAAAVALDYGDGAHLIDTLAQAYHPMAEAVSAGALAYLDIGGWDTERYGPGQHSLDRNLIEAIKKGNPAIVHAFLEKGSDPNTADADGGPALHWAAAAGNPEIVSLLLARGADAEALDGTGARAADIAKKRGKTEVLERLRPLGAGR